MKSQVANEVQAYVLDMQTEVGTLWAPEGDGLRCFACGHRCLIGEGKRGICKVRFNRDGELRVPFGYVAALQCDPVEKKPFFHVYPGSDALTFGMLGCDYHCSYCFPGDTVALTDRGPKPLADLFCSAEKARCTHDAEIAYPAGLSVVAGSGQLRKVRAVFKHAYRGKLTVIKPYYLPALSCTPDHRIYATTDARVPPQPIEARNLTEQHYLAVPRCPGFSSSQVIDAVQELGDHQVTYGVRWDLSRENREEIRLATARGETSRQIGVLLGKSASYIRHVRCKLARGGGSDFRSGGALVENATLRFPNEHRPGIPLSIPLDSDFARLLGFYCAEGSVVASKKRPNSHVLNFSFGPNEGELADDVCRLLQQCLGVKAARVQRATTLGVAVGKASAALLFGFLAGKRASEKRVPEQVFGAPRPVIEAFLAAYIRGDGHRYENGKISVTTVSRKLAYGIAALALKLGFLPSVYVKTQEETGVIQGRKVKLASHQYTVVWYEQAEVIRRGLTTENFHLIPIRHIGCVDHEGDVYNLEVEGEHNYLAGLLLVSNCQNWLTSQALRDSAANAPTTPVTPAQLVAMARRENARLVVSSYNEPLITAEWAVAVFKEANPAGLLCAFVSNGNATPEALDYLRPWIRAYKVDLKSFDDRHYRSLGGTLKQVLETIQMVHERGIWLEVVTLVIPGFNDGEAELRSAARFLASVSRDIPWHLTAFHPDYKMTDPPPTDSHQVVRAAEIGAEEGLRFVYAGNLPGRVGPWENTHCPSCREVLIKRFGYLIRGYHLGTDGRCPRCNTQVPGIWPANAGEVRTGDLSAYAERLPRRVRQ